MNANEKEKGLLEAAGFSFEYPGFWSKDIGDTCVTISDGMGINGYMWEVQALVNDASECVLATEGFASVQDALDHVEREFPDASCPECERSYGPHYSGACEH